MTGVPDKFLFLIVAIHLGPLARSLSLARILISQAANLSLSLSSDSCTICPPPLISSIR